MVVVLPDPFTPSTRMTWGGPARAGGACSTARSFSPTASRKVARTEAASELQPTDADDAESTETIEPEATTEVSAAPPAQPAGSGSATLTLSNGEVFEFGILCSLEPQEAAGSEILFAVVSYDDPYNLDVTQFAAGSFDGAANISVYDSTSYDTVWEASTLYGTDVELSMAGSTVAGSGEFLAGGELGGETVTGELVANC